MASGPPAPVAARQARPVRPWLGLSRGAAIVVAALVLLRVFLLVALGPLIPDDAHGYVEYADFILSDPARWLTARLAERPDEPVWLWLRMPGYPMVIAAAKVCAGSGWATLLTLTQSLVWAFAATSVYRVAHRILPSERSALILLGIYGLATPLVIDIAVLTDSFYATLSVVLVCTTAVDILDARRVGAGRAVALGALLVPMLMLRESTQYVAVLFWPWLAVWAIRCGSGTWRRRAMIALVAALPLVGAVQATHLWNEHRMGAAMLSTGAMTANLYALVAADRSGVPVFDGDDEVDRFMRGRPDAPIMDDVWAALHHLRETRGVGYTELAHEMSARQAAAWREHPADMARGAVARLGPRPFLDLTNPMHTAYLVHLWRTGRPLGPWSHETLARVLRGEPTWEDGVSLAANAPGWALNLVLILASLLAAPVALRRTRSASDVDVRIVVVGLAALFWGWLGLFALNHIELRYLAPVVPALLVAGGWAVSRARTLTLRGCAGWRRG